jgi:hypothetical protein
MVPFLGRHVVPLLRLDGESGGRGQTWPHIRIQPKVKDAEGSSPSSTDNEEDSSRDALDWFCRELEPVLRPIQPPLVLLQSWSPEEQERLLRTRLVERCRVIVLWPGPSPDLAAVAAAEWLNQPPAPEREEVDASSCSSQSGGGRLLFATFFPLAMLVDTFRQVQPCGFFFFSETKKKYISFHLQSDFLKGYIL